MLTKSLPMSNTERQREFRERNPGYYGRLHRQRLAEEQALAAAQAAAATVRAPLALPAPVEAILIPGMTTIPANPAAIRDPLPIAMPRYGNAETDRLG